ncbi:MAG TPA: glycosyltransferase [Syntrophorhabdaceae bacterium]|nr:glycosyltransferase [Syntrophorhabdaceae bacterium]
MHIPRKYYSEALPGIPTIRPFETLVCSTPLVSTPWNDSEEFFRTGVDYLQADNPVTMQAAIEMLCANEDIRAAIALKGLQTIRTNIRVITGHVSS